MHDHPKHPMAGGPASAKHSRMPLLLIGIGKLCKAAGLVFVSFFAGYLLGPAHHQRLSEMLSAWQLDPHNHHLYGFLEKILAISPRDLRVLRVGTLIYAALFILEGIGLVLDKAWGEWLLVVTTGLLLPVEVWEIIERGTVLPVVVFLVNVGIMVYVCFRLKWRLQDRRVAKALPSTPGVLPS